MAEQRPIADSKPTNKGMRRRVRLLAIAMAAFLTWAAFIAWDQQGRLNVKAAELEQLENELRETVKINEDFQKEIRRLNDPEYILQHIRKQYHYTKPGETLFYTPKSP